MTEKEEEQLKSDLLGDCPIPESFTMFPLQGSHLNRCL